MGIGVDFGLLRAELAIEYLPIVADNPQPAPTESEARFFADQIARTNPSILIDTDKAVNLVEDEAFSNIDLSKSGDTIMLTREQLRGLLARSALSGVSITATKVGLALMRQQQRSHLLDLEPLDHIVV